MSRIEQLKKENLAMERELMRALEAKHKTEGELEDLKRELRLYGTEYTCKKCHIRSRVFRRDETAWSRCTTEPDFCDKLIAERNEFDLRLREAKDTIAQLLGNT